MDVNGNYSMFVMQHVRSYSKECWFWENNRDETLKFVVVIDKVAIYVLPEARHGVEVAIASAAAISKVALSNGHCTQFRMARTTSGSSFSRLA